MSARKQPFALVPADVIVDPDLSSTGFRVLCVIAARAYSSSFEITYRELAEIIHVSPRQAIRAIQNVLATDYVRVTKRTNRSNSYSLNPEIFKVNNRFCARCKEPSYRLSKAAWCSKCHKQVDAERLISKPRLMVLHHV